MWFVRYRTKRFVTRPRHWPGGDAGAGPLLIAVALAALAAANSPARNAYHHLLDDPLPWSPIAQLGSAHAWIGDALMAVFFFVVGLEIKREAIDGTLADARARRLPVLAALAGMALPALCYLGLAGTAMPLASGWAIPAATDIAFAVGIIGLVGRRVPPSLRSFLLTVAIVDDLGAVAIIALFYTAGLAPAWLAAAAAVLAGMIALNRAGARRGWPYLPLTLVLWYCVLRAGIHPTVAGVAAAFTIPYRQDGRGNSLLLRLEHALEPWSSYLVVPLFGFANAGVALSGATTPAGATMLPWAIGAGLFVGKQAGVLGAIVLADRTGFATRPEGASRAQVWGTAVLCGIGFTMSLFIGALAFARQPELYERAKLGVLAGSLASTVLGYAILRLAPSAQPAERTTATNASP